MVDGNILPLQDIPDFYCINSQTASNWSCWYANCLSHSWQHHKKSSFLECDILVRQYLLLFFRDWGKIFVFEFDASTHELGQQVNCYYVKYPIFRILGLGKLKKAPRFTRLITYIDALTILISGRVVEAFYFFLLILLVEVIQVMDGRMIYTKKYLVISLEITLILTNCRW